MVILTECPNMFWGITVDAGKRYSQEVKQSFHLSMAALENNPSTSKGFVQVMLQHGSSEYLLCTLQHGNLLQQPLDLLFATGEHVSFSLNGTGVVHLTGYLNPELHDDTFGYDEDDDPDYDNTMEEEPVTSSEEEELPELVPAKEVFSGMKRKAISPSAQSKRLKLLNLSTPGESDDDDDDDEEEEDFSDDFEDSYFNDVEDDDEEEEEEEESPAQKVNSKSPVQQAKLGTPGKAKKKIVTPKKEEKTPKKEEKTPKKEVKTPKKDVKTPKKDVKTPKQQAETSMSDVNTSVADTPENGESKKKKKKKKKNKGDGDNSLVDSSRDTPKANTPGTIQSPKKRVVSGGTVVEDVKVGHGPEAKPGKMVSMYYVGTLAKNSKRFDSCEKGRPFRFRLNQGEVIKGWDTGVIGMKVGGKRKILVPASQAYGNVKQGPIPPNSALVFEIELKAVS